MLRQNTQPLSQPKPGASALLRAPLGALQQAYAANRALALLGVLMLITLGASLSGLALDPRTINGAPAWLKPFKFAVSIALYSFTLLWMLSFVENRPRLVRAISWVSLLAFLVETVVIIAQVLRGTTSHFNVGSAFDQAMFSFMGMFVLAIWAMNLLAAILLLAQRMADPALAWALRLGLLLTLVGAGLGFLMTRPTAEQLAGLRAGQAPTVIGAHSVGAPDDGPGMPVTHWSTTGGDLRVAHFVGLHAMQALPIVGLLLARRRRLSARRRLALVWVAGLSYLALIGLAAWQALRGQPLLAPDATTLAAAAAWLGATALGVVGAWGLGATPEA